MRFLLTIAVVLATSGCTVSPQPQISRNALPLLAAERLIDAFYSFDPAPLEAALSDAPASAARIVYYQGWAEGGNYAVLDRKPCRLMSADEARCEITVRDDLIAALGTGYWVTDTFHLTLLEGRIVKVRTSSNDPPEFKQAFD